jgi:hypothetical protein
MGLENQIRRLEQQRREHLHQANVAYHRLRRDVQRIASPGRMVRRHLGAVMAASGVAGMLLAPGPKYVKADNGQKKRTKPSRGRRIAGVAARLAWPPARTLFKMKFRGGKDKDDKHAEGPKRGLLSDAIVADLMALVARKIPWAELVRRARQRTATPTDMPPCPNSTTPGATPPVA